MIGAGPKARISSADRVQGLSVARKIDLPITFWIRPKISVDPFSPNGARRLQDQGAVSAGMAVYRSFEFLISGRHARDCKSA